jgi:ABC-type sugar transport system ATPase subunit
MNSAENLLEVRDIAKRFGSVVALRSATLSVRPGEVHALMGANGAGKSTLVKILTGVYSPDRGTIPRIRFALPPRREPPASFRSIRTPPWFLI